jgi:hypothetical protein
LHPRGRSAAEVGRARRVDIERPVTLDADGERVGRVFRAGHDVMTHEPGGLAAALAAPTGAADYLVADLARRSCRGPGSRQRVRRAAATLPIANRAASGLRTDLEHGPNDPGRNTTASPAPTTAGGLRHAAVPAARALPSDRIGQRAVPAEADAAGPAAEIPRRRREIRDRTP